MEKLTLKCEIVTPLLMHGADGKTPELREQSFKGIMRFWWRAIYGNLPLKELKEKEAEIFGNKKQKSCFRIKINSYHLDEEKFNPLPHKDSNFKINGFSPNQTFGITFLGQNLELVKNIFILSTVLGGFGQRSRRGFGSIKVLEIKDKENKQVDFDYPLTKNRIEQFMKDKINKDFLFSKNNYHDFKSYPFIKEIDIGKEYNNYEILLKKIGLATHEFPKFGGKGNDRFASPLYISVIKESEKYNPIVTTLNSTRKISFRDINDFKKEIL